MGYKMNYRYEIEFSDVGRDLIARDRFYQGDTILTLPLAPQPNPDRYSIEVIPGVHINCSDDYSGAINHSCNPNAAVRNRKIVAWTCIQPGDSITIDYKKTEQKLAEPFDCRCGSKKCRGRIE